MIMTAASALAAAICAAVAVWNIVQRGKLEQQLKSTYDALSEKERAYDELKKRYDGFAFAYRMVLREKENFKAESEKTQQYALMLESELKAARNELDEARQRTEAVQNALAEVQNIWNYVGNSDGQQEVS